MEHPNNEKGVIVEDKGLIKKEKDEFQQLLQGKTTKINQLQKIQIVDSKNIDQVKKDTYSVEKKLKIRIDIFRNIKRNHI